MITYTGSHDGKLPCTTGPYCHGRRHFMTRALPNPHWYQKTTTKNKQGICLPMTKVPPSIHKWPFSFTGTSIPRT